MLRYGGWMLAIWCCVTTTALGEDGKLEAVRDAVRSPDSTSAAPERKDSSPSINDQRGPDGDNPWNNMCELAFALAVASPFAVPHLILDDHFGVPGYFSMYPYADDFHSFMRLDPEGGYYIHRTDSGADPFVHTSPWMIRLAIEESNDFDGLNRVMGHLLIDTRSRFGLQSSWIQLHERLRNGTSDDMLQGDVNLVYRFAQCEEVQMRSGLGVRYMTDRYDSNFGINFTYGADFFPVKPFVFSASGDLGTLGSAGVVHGRATGGVSYRHGEAYIGYDFLRIGSTNLQGPVVGVRLWF